MSAADPNDHRLDHVVVLMFENRSFDTLLGSLYSAAERPAFEGIARAPAEIPVPVDAAGGDTGPVRLHPAVGFSGPYPDPGEEYPHVNTQLFGVVDPEANRFAEVDDMSPPFNAPAGAAQGLPRMDGFVADYVNAFRDQMGRLPNRNEYSQIMAYYTPAQVPVLSGLARGFACFDHWFCEVPSQTYPNRSFFHAGSSSGFVVNGPPGKFASRNTAPTIFERLEAAGRSWRVYYDPAQFLPATGLIHASRLGRFFATHFSGMADFYTDAAAGTLPDYAFIEPNMFHPHTDMHPHSGARIAEELQIPPPDTLRGGEGLLAKVYDAVRRSASPGGSAWSNTALLVTFDEHGGTYDHVPPPPAVPPDRAGGPNEMGFAFDRSGVRIPTILVSAWVDSGRLVSDPFRSTSLITTLREWWGLGAPLTARDASAPSLLPLLTRAAPLPPESWPSVTPRAEGVLGRAVDRIEGAIEDLEVHFGRLERDMLGDALALEADQSGVAPRGDARTISHREAHAHFRRMQGAWFPKLVARS